VLEQAQVLALRAQEELLAVEEVVGLGVRPAELEEAEEMAIVVVVVVVVVVEAQIQVPAETAAQAEHSARRARAAA